MAGGRLCVLGAGECNDLDLERLVGSFREIHLVDVDGKALMRAVARQPAPVRARLKRHALDLSGLSPRRLERWRRAPPEPSEIEAAAAGAMEGILDKLEGPAGGAFEVVASTCMLTQLAFSVARALGDRHPALEAVRLALMRTHLSTLISLVTPGGAALLATDLVSSTTFDLPRDRDAAELMREVVQKGAGYFAANPEILAGLLSEVATPELLPPWLWTGPLERTYLVYALRLRLPADAEP
jgi:hypothetical protein